MKSVAKFKFNNIPFRVSGIYKIVCKSTNDFYIGSSVNVRTRLWNHVNKLLREKHDNSHLQRAWNKYKIENFEFEILEETPRDSLLLIEREQWFLDELKPSYNICLIAGSTSGRRRTEEFKQKMSQTMKGRKPTDFVLECARESNLGKILSKETKEKISIANKGKPSPMKGKRHSDSTIEKQKKLYLENPWTTEQGEYLGSFHRGEKNSSAKLKEEQVREIRFLYKNTKTSCEKLGKQFGITRAVIHKIVTNKLWKCALDND